MSGIILTSDNAKRFLYEYFHPKCNKLRRDYENIHTACCEDHIEIKIDYLNSNN